jgi:hypothetical protein
VDPGVRDEAVRAFIDCKYAQGTGTFRDGGAATAWEDGRAVQSRIPAYSEKSIAATIADCRYIYERYGRFPASTGPFTNSSRFRPITSTSPLTIRRQARRWYPGGAEGN